MKSKTKRVGIKKVKDLRKKLEKMDGELPFYFVHDADDCPYDEVKSVTQEEVKFGEMMDPDKAKLGKHKAVVIEIDR